MATFELVTDAQSGRSPASLSMPPRVLLVGAREEDFFLIREILGRTRPTLSAELEHAHSLEEAKIMLQQKDFGLVLFEHETGDSASIQLLSRMRHDGVPPGPFIVLTENADEKMVAETIAAGAWDCVDRSQMDGVNLIRTIRSTLALHSLRQEQQATEESLPQIVASGGAVGRFRDHHRPRGSHRIHQPRL